MKQLPIKDLPFKVQSLVKKHQQARVTGDFTLADSWRAKIERQGYEVRDVDGQVQVWAELEKPENSLLVLFGSGEISDAGQQIHDQAFQLIGKSSIKIVLVSTPAGFQPNVDIVYKEIADFFLTRLPNYHPQVKIIFANDRSKANDKKLIEPVSWADYIFTGPGSPTYAVDHLKDTLLLDTIINQVKSGATLSLASAATIAFSRFCLPVYQIYKVGEPLGWKEGLDVYSRLFEKLTVVPHYNNTEGGAKLDTSRCFMGRQRFCKLLKLLPKAEKVWGIDELTGVIINLKTKSQKVLGKGQLRLIQINF